ncbi:hypothetical protein [Mucilaginibacter gotjawali]|uniref:hypothetical protein n=1 Tax=Mucilaginibacter gotjawali TaxID=1550579 RepID=UPI0012FDC1AF|nr:hypothetical protein [Mucilaginibacter gotjawali]
MNVLTYFIHKLLTAAANNVGARAGYPLILHKALATKACIRYYPWRESNVSYFRRLP